MTTTTETAVTRPVLVASSPVRGGRGVQELYYCPSGWRVAGSGVRWQEGNLWLSTCEIGGARHGSYFTDETRAREHFAARAMDGDARAAVLAAVQRLTADELKEI